MDDVDRCVCCGAVIPEGRQVCPICEQKAQRRESWDYWLNEWVFPLLVGGVLIAAFIGLVNIA